MAHTKQSRPNSVTGFQGKFLETIQVVPSSLEGGYGSPGHHLSLSHTHSLSLSLTRTHTHTHTLSLSSLSVTHRHSLAHTHTHTLSLSYRDAEGARGDGREMAEVGVDRDQRRDRPHLKVLNVRTTTSQKCVAVPRRARI